MRILVLMKRFGAGKDMVLFDFGRQIRLFENIAKDNDVDFFVVDYKKRETRNLSLHGMKFYIRPYSIFSHFSFFSELNEIIKRKKYDFIVGSTDPLLGIIACKLGKKHDIKSVYDMQDEYSIYSSYKIPFVKMMDKKAIKNSDVVFTVSESLNDYIKKIRTKKTVTIENGIDLSDFKKAKKETARKKLGLSGGKLVIYAGEISKFKGVDVLIEAFSHVKMEFPECRLLLTGPIIDVDLEKPGIIYRKYPKREDLVMVLFAADVAVLPNPSNTFSKYSFPYKLMEYMAANIPIVTTNIGDVSKILEKYEGSICSYDTWDMAAKISKKLKNSSKMPNYDIKRFEWENLSKKAVKILLND